MGGVRLGPLTRLAPPKPVVRFVHRLSRQLHRGPELLTSAGDPVRLDPLLATARRLREAREARGLSLRDLALETRISTSVLEALERAWRERLPEAAYLRTMLTLLERHLQLPAGSLHGALPADGERHPHPATAAPSRGGRLQPFSIELVGTRQGAAAYALLSLALIYGLNLQQQRLAGLELLSRPPLPSADAEAGATDAGATELLLQGFPELRPLRSASAGVARARLRQDRRSERADLAAGVLRLRLERPSDVLLRGATGGAPTQLRAVQGDLSLPVLPPFRLTIVPAPAGGPAGSVEAGATVLWNGQPLAGRQGDYRYPPSPQPAPPAARRP